MNTTNATILAIDLGKFNSVLCCYEKWLDLQANGCSKKKAIVALARKLLVRCWAMLRSGQPWREPSAVRDSVASQV